MPTRLPLQTTYHLAGNGSVGPSGGESYGGGIRATKQREMI